MIRLLMPTRFWILGRYCAGCREGIEFERVISGGGIGMAWIDHSLPISFPFSFPVSRRCCDQTPRAGRDGDMVSGPGLMKGR